MLGSERGTYYVGERELTLANASNVQRCIARDGLRTIHRIVDISVSGRAPKNDPAIFALSLVAAARAASRRPSVRWTGWLRVLLLMPVFLLALELLRWNERYTSFQGVHSFAMAVIFLVGYFILELLLRRLFPT